MKDIMVSVVCTCYNHGRFIRNCLQNFVSQKTNFRYEVIVHDDASTDDSGKIIREFEEKYPEIIKPIYQKENQHSKKVKIIQTFILPQLRGKYVAFCEGDDCWIDDHKLQKQVDFLEANPDYVACIHNTVYHDCQTGQETIRYGTVEKDVTLSDVIVGGGAEYHTSSLMVKREIFVNRPPWVFTIPGVGDYPSSIYYATAGKMHYLPDVMSVYNLGTEGSWTKRVSKNRKRRILVKEKTLDMLKTVNQQFDYAYKDIFEKQMVNLEYDLALEKGDIKKLKGDQFVQLYQSEPIVKRIRTEIKHYLPWLIDLREKFGR